MTALRRIAEVIDYASTKGAFDPFRSFSFFLFCRHYQHSIPADVSKHLVKLREVDPGPGHQGDQPSDEVQWLENHVGGAVVVRCFQLIAYLSVVGHGQALGRYCRSAMA